MNDFIVEENEGKHFVCFVGDQSVKFPVSSRPEALKMQEYLDRAYQLGFSHGQLRAQNKMREALGIE